MWPFTKRTARQKEIRRSKAERHGVWYRRWPERSTVLVALNMIVTAILAVLILNLGGRVLGLREGQVTPRAISTRVELRIDDERQTELLRVRARDRSPNYYKLDVSLMDDIRGRLASALTLRKAHADDLDTLLRAAAENNVLFDKQAWDELGRLIAADSSEEYQRIVDAVVTRLKNVPLVEPEPAGTRRTPTEAVLYDPTVPREIRREMTELRFSNDAAAVERVVSDVCAGVAEPLRSSFARSIQVMLRSEDDDATMRPVYRFDTTRSVQRAQAAYEAVAPVATTYGIGDQLADAGVITADELQLLQAEHDVYEEQPVAQREGWLQFAGQTLLTFLIVIGVAGYMRRYQPGVFTNHFRRMVSIAALLLILAIARFTFLTGDIPPHLSIGLQALAAGLLAVVYADEAVFVICGALAMLLTMAMQQSVAFFIILLVVSGTMVFGLSVVRNRGKISFVGVVAGMIAFVTSLAVGWFDGQRFDFVLGDSLWAGGATMMAGFIIEGVLPAVERMFRLSTDMTLLEWCDASKPLMRAMAADAPGTYNHSLLVGALAEAAAEAVGANGLLCRAGSYYHDIGKINKPEYFVENQTAGLSRHDKLSPAMSLLVIIGHVKDGIEMAKEYSIPTSLIPFIAEHHGTTLVQYFYHAASQSRKPEDREIPDTEFRYPGPKPQARERAIVMLCDGVEGAVRAMSEPTPGRIEAVVSEIVQKRLSDGQFDECDLTFRELAEIEKSLVKSLCGIYHSRISYPKDEEKKSAS